MSLQQIQQQINYLIAKAIRYSMEMKENGLASQVTFTAGEIKGLQKALEIVEKEMKEDA